jgi:RNA-binding protein YlmH
LVIRAMHRGPITENEKEWQRQFARKVQAVAEGQSGFQTAFLDPLQRAAAEAVQREAAHTAYAVWGGYPGAERVCLHVYRAGRPGEPPGVACIRLAGQFPGNAGHRDYLGALLGLGLRRDQVGDIILLPEGAAVFVVEAMAAYICGALTRVGDMPVSCSAADAALLPLPGREGKEIGGTVASLRLDAVLSLGFGLSRSRVVLLIKAGLARVNWRPVDSPSFSLREGDLVSLQGKGRLQLLAVQGETRKGRIRLNMKKFS